MSTATLEQNTEQETKPFEGEYCDACGSRGVWVVHFEASELAFCNHHHNRFKAKFADKRNVKIVEGEASS